MKKLEEEERLINEQEHRLGQQQVTSFQKEQNSLPVKFMAVFLVVGMLLGGYWMIMPSSNDSSETIEPSPQPTASVASTEIQSSEPAPQPRVTAIEGLRSSTTTNDFDIIKVRLNILAGADAIDLRNVKLTMQNETVRIENIEYVEDTGAGTLTPIQFYVEELRDDDNSLDPSTTTSTVINPRDIVNLVLKPGTSMNFPTREPVRIEIKPEFGNIIINEFITPASYGVKNTIVLYP